MDTFSQISNSDFILPFLYGKIDSLPTEMQKEVSHFIDFLLSKNSRKVIPTFGSLKGKIHIASDFDAPLSDF